MRIEPRILILEFLIFRKIGETRTVYTLIMKKWADWIPVVLGALVIGGVIFSFWYQAQLKLTETPVSEVKVIKKCVVGGCSEQLCVSDSVKATSTCEWLESYACYKDATCELQKDGKCGWTMDDELKECLDKSQNKITL